MKQTNLTQFRASTISHDSIRLIATTRSTDFVALFYFSEYVILIAALFF